MSWPARRPAVPANCKALDLAVVERALVDLHGNVTAAARSLSVPSVDLRKLVWATPLLADAVFEQLEQKIDEAEEVLHQGLRSSDLGLRLQAARFLLRQSEFGRRRGWGRGPRRGKRSMPSLSRSSGSTSRTSVARSAAAGRPKCFNVVIADSGVRHPERVAR
jgi:hypothetical protein